VLKTHNQEARWEHGENPASEHAICEESPALIIVASADIVAGCYLSIHEVPEGQDGGLWLVW
jgi:hypothetical protein